MSLRKQQQEVVLRSQTGEWLGNFRAI